MASDVLVAVLLAAFLHATWNAMAKSGAGDALTRSALIGIGSALAALPVIAVVGFPDAASWPYLLASAIVHVGYFVLIGLAYRHADYSAIYPLLRGGAPLFTALLATFLFGELLTPLAWLGLILLCCGIIGLSADGLRGGALSARGMLVAALTGVTIVTYTLIDGAGARMSGDAASYVSALAALTGLFILPLLVGLRGPALRWTVAAFWPKALAGGAMGTLSYGTALWAMTKAPIGLVGALREVSVLFAAAIGAAILKENFGAARWIAACVIVTGLVLAKAA
jgi:drug/metabolite transporter (DMT)-like permease